MEYTRKNLVSDILSENPNEIIAVLAGLMILWQMKYLPNTHVLLYAAIGLVLLGAILSAVFKSIYGQDRLSKSSFTSTLLGAFILIAIEAYSMGLVKSAGVIVAVALLMGSAIYTMITDMESMSNKLVSLVFFILLGSLLVLYLSKGHIIYLFFFLSFLAYGLLVAAGIYRNSKKVENESETE